MPEPRAIVFDLDDTLYPYRAFVRSGFRAVSCRLAEERGLPRVKVLHVLRRALDGVEHGRELQALCARFELPLSIVPALITIMREHSPTLRLPCQTRRVLGALRSGWKVGILTNGSPDIQRRKMAALGVMGLVDDVMCAADCVNGGKPSPVAFRAMLERLRTSPDRSVFVGDDLEADIVGASAIAMRTIHVTSGISKDTCRAANCNAHVSRLEDVAAIADALVPARN